jgi:hypothetical protein
VPDVSELLRKYDAQLRVHVPKRLPRGLEVERDGPVVRFMGLSGGGFVLYRDLGGLQGPELDELIARQVRVFAERGERFEWKLHGHDEPADLPDRLQAAGFVPEEVETVVVAPVSAIAGPPEVPEAVSLRAARGRDDLERVAALEAAVWGGDRARWPRISRPSSRRTRKR